MTLFVWLLLMLQTPLTMEGVYEQESTRYRRWGVAREKTDCTVILRRGKRPNTYHGTRHFSHVKDQDLTVIRTGPFSAVEYANPPQWTSELYWDPCFCVWRWHSLALVRIGK